MQCVVIHSVTLSLEREKGKGVLPEVQTACFCGQNSEVPGKYRGLTKADLKGELNSCSPQHCRPKGSVGLDSTNQWG